MYRAVGIVLALVALGCGDVDNGDADPCVSGCEATVAAACSNGPPDQAECETACESFRQGTCGPEYEVLLQCGDGASVSCDAEGLPQVDGCSTEQQAFIDCLNL